MTERGENQMYKQDDDNEESLDFDFNEERSTTDEKVGQTSKESFKSYNLNDLKPKVRNRLLEDETKVYTANAWDNYEWNEELEANAISAVEKNSTSLVDDEKREMYESKANDFWDQFYGIHQHKFFKDRNWLFTEFPELGYEVPVSESGIVNLDREEVIAELRNNENYTGEKSKFKILEVGCGAGNSVFPILSTNLNSHTFLYCCDFSSKAIDVVKSNPKYESSSPVLHLTLLPLLRCAAFVLDITSETFETPFPPESIDIIILIFVVSAISPDKFDRAIQRLHALLKPGGLILFRDYGRYDLAQLRFKEGRCISENFYVRGDGTRVYFFTKDEVIELFEKHKFVNQRILIDRRLVVNRHKKLKMYRVWIMGTFQKIK